MRITVTAIIIDNIPLQATEVFKAHLDHVINYLKEPVQQRIVWNKETNGSGSVWLLAILSYCIIVLNSELTGQLCILSVIVLDHLRQVIPVN